MLQLKTYYDCLETDVQRELCHEINTRAAEMIFDEWLLGHAQGTVIAKIVSDHTIIVKKRS